MLAISVFMALSEAVAACGPAGAPHKLQAPATPERVLAAIAATTHA
jgi:xanthine dehydrogenase large subunit